MKFKFLAIGLSMLALSSAHIEAKRAKDASLQNPKILLSKDKAKIAFLGAEDTSSITLPTSYIRLPFTQDQLSHGKSITPDITGSQFLLQKGSYKISFTGTFQNTTGEDQYVYYTIALQVGPNIIFVNTDNQEDFGGDDFNISSLYKVIEVDKPTYLSVLAKNSTPSSFPSATVAVTTRSIVIQKL